MRSIQGLLAEVAYLRRSCDYLLESLADLERAAGRIDRLDPLQETMIESQTLQGASAIKGHLDIATRFAEDWKAHVEDVAT